MCVCVCVSVRVRLCVCERERDRERERVRERERDSRGMRGKREVGEHIKHHRTTWPYHMSTLLERLAPLLHQVQR